MVASNRYRLAEAHEQAEKEKGAIAKAIAYEVSRNRMPPPSLVDAYRIAESKADVTFTEWMEALGNDN